MYIYSYLFCLYKSVLVYEQLPPSDNSIAVVLVVIIIITIITAFLK